MGLASEASKPKLNDLLSHLISLLTVISSKFCIGIIVIRFIRFSCFNRCYEVLKFMCIIILSAIAANPCNSEPEYTVISS